MRESYFRRGRLGRIKAAAADVLLARLRNWDRRTADRVTHFVAISETIRRRIHDCYDRDSTVIYPPVDTDFYAPAAVPREDYYLVVSALAPYKRFDLAVAACNRLGRKLVVIGRGQEEAKLRALTGPSVSFLGWQSDEVVRDHYRRCRAVLFPAEEDFGIVPVEAQACGAPVIALGRGGSTETIRPLGTTAEPGGVFFDLQTVDAVTNAIERFEREAGEFDPRAARRAALPFCRERYEAELFGYVERVIRGEADPVRKAA
jgi:glycosyltransferase involved in cell wall biosynthesis